MRRIILGLTGSFGSGKSTVAVIFKSLGAQVIDADRIAHRVTKTGNLVYKKIIRSFGKGILKKNKSINRVKLARIVFTNSKSLRTLNRITHPQIIRTIKKKIALSKRKIIILDAPLLIEAGLDKAVDKVIVVKASIPKIQNRLGLSRAEIIKRVTAQLCLKDKIKKADFIIDNSRSFHNTKKQVKRVWKEICKMEEEWKN